MRPTIFLLLVLSASAFVAGGCQCGPAAQPQADAGLDAGSRADAGANADAGGNADAGVLPDAGNNADAGNIPDAGSNPDAGNSADGGSGLSNVKTVFLILMENHDWSAIHGNASAPYINNVLLDAGAYASQYYNPPGLHPSEPNYLWLEAGTNFSVTNDGAPCVNHQSATHLASLLNNAGLSWKAYQEDIADAGCALNAVNNYAPKHNPFVFFSDVTGPPPGGCPWPNTYAGDSFCNSHVRPYGELVNDLDAGTVARYNFVTPNLIDDMHDGTIQDGDSWLAANVPVILGSAAYQQQGLLLITWDEGESGDGPIGMIVLSPFAKGGGYTNAIHYDHSSTLRTLQEIFGVSPFLGAAAAATDLGDFFN